MDLKSDLIDPILEREGGFVDRADDRGGPTNFGVTLATFRGYHDNAALTTDDLKALTREAAKDLLWDEFVVKPGIAKIPHPAILEVVADAAVNHSPPRAIKMLQRALGFAEAKVDGVLGPVTLAAIPYLSGERVARLALCKRLRVYTELARTGKRDADNDGVPDDLENLPGWTNRAVALLEKYA